MSVKPQKSTSFRKISAGPDGLTEACCLRLTGSRCAQPVALQRL